MFANRLATAATIAAATVVFALSALMMWIYASEPRTGSFSAKFHLTDHLGRPADQGLFKGQPSLVYFGYTHCPVACPTTLYEMAGFFEKLGDEGKNLKGYFFTIDPERDSQEVVNGYVTAFTDRITGFTGEPEEMRKVVDGWRVHAEKVPDGSGGYSMDHTLTLFLVGADGRLKGVLPYGTDQDGALDKIRTTLLKS
ncbi:SCO family protein [Rhizobium sp. LC145]|uniref:SCO family protein n=1 Tax=Rhizobium sp. LC145 TaxID=1120688 RepID=UPI00069C0B7C|nr:SCO family protein [Rhizobium sp. LC145]TKT45986.1 SCO family protein [Rhizobiaceae bacterium LC148]